MGLLGLVSLALGTPLTELVPRQGELWPGLNCPESCRTSPVPLPTRSHHPGLLLAVQISDSASPGSSGRTSAITKSHLSPCSLQKPLPFHLGCVARHLRALAVEKQLGKWHRAANSRAIPGCEAPRPRAALFAMHRCRSFQLETRIPLIILLLLPSSCKRCGR